MEYSDVLRLIDDRAAAFRAAIADAPDLDAPVPSCPGWTLFDLAQHLGEGRRKWAAIAAAGPADAPPPKPVWESPAPRDRAALLDWWDASARQLVDALREAGPDRGCWSWWGRSQSPETTGAAARHQLQEIAVHTYDAQLTVGAPQPLPEEVALDGVDEFLATCAATTVAWPHEPAVVDHHATEGRSWRLFLNAEGARNTGSTRHPAEAADASVEGTASDIVLLFYCRIPLDALKVEGDRRVLDQLIAWEPE
ncbi:maleylpyruvate isomerase family mycothiol-dependent enzyme [Actinoplanes missouriensis]|uniref:maleylpyruvate isomerase family mycothiol-dependent enzyme n=1 Tax=Actinoplanes missouriensis TaxID=1866 RepID=UPI0033C6AD19